MATPLPDEEQPPPSVVRPDAPRRVPVDELVILTRSLDLGLHVAQARLVELARTRGPHGA